MITVSDSRAQRKPGSKWFRSWRNKIDSHKVFSLNAEQYRFWDMCLCLTDADGYLPSLAAISFRLRMPEQDARRLLVSLIEMAFVDVLVSPDGASVLHRMHDWDVWQRPSTISDPTAGERVRRHRARKKAKSSADHPTSETARECPRESARESHVTGVTSVSVSSSSNPIERRVLPREDLGEVEGISTRDARTHEPAREGAGTHAHLHAHEPPPPPRQPPPVRGNGRLPGAHPHKASGKWQARIRVCGRQHHLGTHRTPEAAHEAYVAACRSPAVILGGSRRGDGPVSAYQMAKDGDLDVGGYSASHESGSASGGASAWRQSASREVGR